MRVVTLPSLPSSIRSTYGVRFRLPCRKRQNLLVLQLKRQGLVAHMIAVIYYLFRHQDLFHHQVLCRHWGLFRHRLQAQHFRPFPLLVRPQQQPSLLIVQLFLLPVRLPPQPFPPLVQPFLLPLLLRLLPVLLPGLLCLITVLLYPPSGLLYPINALLSLLPDLHYLVTAPDFIMHFAVLLMPALDFSQGFSLELQSPLI